MKVVDPGAPWPRGPWKFKGRIVPGGIDLSVDGQECYWWEYRLPDGIRFQYYFQTVSDFWPGQAVASTP